MLIDTELNTSLTSGTHLGAWVPSSVHPSDLKWGGGGDIQGRRNFMGT